MRRAKQLGIKIGINNELMSLESYRNQKIKIKRHFSNLLKDDFFIPIDSKHNNTQEATKGKKQKTRLNIFSEFKEDD